MARRTLVLMLAVVLCAGLAQAGTRADLSGDAVVDFATTMDMPFVTVGNPGNVGEQNRLGFIDHAYYGDVGYAYNIGKFEVTAGQYTEFLNAVGATDVYGLYPHLLIGETYDIQRAGGAGSYTYSVVADLADRPVDRVNWGDAARFCNWLTNGMPTGVQDLATTEDGSYFLNGAVSDEALAAVTREADAWFVVPTQDEWYKAAYHKNDGVTGNYFTYPTSSDTAPSNVLTNPDPGNNANFDHDLASPEWHPTYVGEFENSPSPYGTFDMGGNLYEMTEGQEDPWMWPHSVIRGAYYGSPDWAMLSNRLDSMSPGWSGPGGGVGFRVVEVPEPATISLVAWGGLTLLRKKWK